MCNAAVFYSVSFLLILFGLFTIKFKNIVYSLLSAVVVFFLTGVLFYILGSEYNAIVQVVIYGVAVPIILGIAIMFTERRREYTKEKSANFTLAVLFMSGLFSLSFIYLLRISGIITQNMFHIMDKIPSDSNGNIMMFAQNIFTKYIVAFELTGLIFLIIFAGLTIFKKELRK